MGGGVWVYSIRNGGPVTSAGLILDGIVAKWAVIVIARTPADCHLTGCHLRTTNCWRGWAVRTT